MYISMYINISYVYITCYIYMVNIMSKYMDYPKYSRNVESCLSYLDLSKANQLKANSKYMQKFWGFQSELFLSV